MAPNYVSKTDHLALVSAASVVASADFERQSGALQSICGQSLLSYQMQILRQAGIDSFLIEVDSVFGELLNIADRFRASGARVEFIRSAKDLQGHLKPGGRLVVQAEGHYFSPSIVADLMQNMLPFIATVDGRDENATFERIDLNTRWAGFALLSTEIAQAVSEIPDGWSIGSSLLRQAIQSNTRFESIPQVRLELGDVVRVETRDDADKIVSQMLQHRTEKPDGFVERYIFGPIAKSIAPVIWSKEWGIRGLDASRLLLAAGSAGIALLGWSGAAALAIFLALLSHSVIAAVQAFSANTLRERWKNGLFWTFVILSAFIATWMTADYSSDTLAFVAISIGLALIANKLTLPKWCAMILLSPALLSLAFLGTAALSAVTAGTKIIALLQIATLVAGLYQPVSRGKNGDYA